MPNLAAALKTEIARIARKEVNGEAQALKKHSAAYRRDIAALKRRVQALERQVKAAGRKPSLASEMSGGQSEQHLRFSAARLRAQRARLGLSAAKFALLLGVSPLSVYKWESGKARPRRAQLEAIAAARKLGKREAAVRLGELEGHGARP